MKNIMNVMYYKSQNVVKLYFILNRYIAVGRGCAW